MGQPCLLVDNFFNSRIYSGHTLSAAEASTDAPLVGAARRARRLLAGHRAHPGRPPAAVVTVQISLPRAKYDSGSKLIALASGANKMPTVTYPTMRGSRAPRASSPPSMPATSSTANSSG